MDEIPWSNLFSVGGVLCLLGAIEVGIVKPIRDRQERSVKLQNFITRSRLEGFEEATRVEALC